MTKRIFINKELRKREKEILQAVIDADVFWGMDAEQVEVCLVALEEYTIRTQGWYHESKDYVGPKGVLTCLIPKIWMNVAAYLHDGAYQAVEECVFSWMTKDIADKLFRVIGDVYDPNKTGESKMTIVYYSAVKWLGKFFLKRGNK